MTISNVLETKQSRCEKSESRIACSSSKSTFVRLFPIAIPNYSNVRIQASQHHYNIHRDCYSTCQKNKPNSIIIIRFDLKWAYKKVKRFEYASNSISCPFAYIHYRRKFIIAQHVRINLPPQRFGSFTNTALDIAPAYTSRVCIIFKNTSTPQLGESTK